MKILNYGSLNIDYVYQVPHFVQAKQTLSSTALTIGAGGKGLNQSIALARAGANVLHVGKIGKDGLFMRDLLEQDGIDVSHIAISEGVSGHAIIQVDTTGQNCILLHGGANLEIDDAQQDTALADCAADDVLLLQCEVAGGAQMMRKAAAKGMRIALNPSPVNDILASLPLELVHWLILNEVEGEALSASADPQTICRVLRDKYPQMNVLLTLGSEGALYYDGETFHNVPALKVNAVDTTAAGDTFTGYFLSRTLQTGDVSAALDAATRAAAAAVTVMGAANSIPRLD